ncbi:MAG: indole-3-glycerol phosphate synthase TrpC [Mobilitalea sp.]
MILDTIAESNRKRVNKAKEILPLEELKKIIYDGAGVRCFNNRNAFAFERAIRKNMAMYSEQQNSNREADKNAINQQTCRQEDITFICEVKKASPSKGIISEEFPYLTIAKDYEKAGADAISVLTEPEYFKGSNEILREISDLVRIPVLRKDFIIDEYQIYETKTIGADAVLLICTLLDTDTLKRYIGICNELGLSALVEAHTEEEVASARKAGARMIGVNNRNLQTFEVDLQNSIKLRSLVPPEIIFIAESGIRSTEDIQELCKAGVNAVLIGESLMRSENKKEMIQKLKNFTTFD